MRVLFVSQEFPPETAWGGIGTYVARTSRRLNERGLEVHVLSVARRQPVSSSEVDGVHVHRFPLAERGQLEERLPEVGVRLAVSAAVGRLVNTLNPGPDVIECPDWNAEGLRLALRRRFPLVTRLHSTARQLFEYSGQGQRAHGLDGLLACRLEEASVRRSNVVLSTRGNLAQWSTWTSFDERAVHITPHIVPLPAQLAYPDSSEPPRVTFVGRLEPRKAPEVLLGAAPRVLAAIPNAKFVFIGRDIGDPARPCSSISLRKEAGRLGIAGSVEFLGELGWESVLEELRRASLCAFPSRWECFPNVAAEAAAVGRPMVVSSIPGFQDLVEDGVTGRVVSGDGAEAWASAITELLSDRDRARGFGEAGSALVRRVVDPDRIADATIEAYANAIERFRRGERAGRRGK